MWEPLPLIVYGYAIHPLTPSKRDARLSTRNRLSTVTEASADDNSIVLKDVVSLEVGDEVYAFEKYTPSTKDSADGPWYRGYVVCTTRRPPVAWSDSSASRPSKLEEPQQVFIGIFPASHIFVRDELPDAEGRLPELAHSLSGRSTLVPSHGDKASLGMESLLEVEESTPENNFARKHFRVQPQPQHESLARGPFPVYPTSIRSTSIRSVSIRSPSPASSQLDRPLPPRPSLKSGDDTASGARQPIIDEIASALREWHTLMFHYLARRDYKLFHIVREHIEALHSGRRQLLARALNEEETVNMIRECVIRLVSGNLVQGLDVIVRHPTWGGLVNVDIENVPDPRSWISAVRMYAMQTSLAYLNVQDEVEIKPYRASTDQFLSGALPTPANSAFPELPYLYRSQSQIGLLKSPANRQSTAKFYHVFLDLRAFVASPCVPGETAELFFSLYKKQGTQFVTEDFCAVLNHNGVLARDPESRIRTLFTDLAYSDIQDPIYLVCRIVRNGSFKLGSSGANGITENGKRGSELTSKSDAGWESRNGSSTNGTRSFSNGDPGSFVRRPFGCAVLELTQLSKMADQNESSVLKEYTMPIYVPTNEASFSMIHQSIINNISKEYDKSPRAEMLAVSVKIFRGDSRVVVRENPSLLQNIPHTLRLGFPDVVFPGDERNELYIKLWCGDFGASHTSSGRLSIGRVPAGNVQISTEIKDQNGRTIEGVISQGSGEPLLSHFHSMVFHRTTEPTFGELIKLKLPPDEMPKWHLFFTFRNRTGREKGGNKNSDALDRPFAFAFQPLFPDSSAFVEDGSHTLVMYRADRLSQVPPDIYLTAPSTLNVGQKADQLVIPQEMQRLAPPLRDTLTVRSSLCSTKFTQNPILFRLLKWEIIPEKEALSTLLTRFTFVGEGEIVKFLRDIFDALFGILISHNNQSGEMDLLVFNALVTVLGIVQDRRFSNFQPVLDVYIEQHFTCATAASHIIHSMNRLLLNPTSEETAPNLRAALKVWHYIFKFIARSRELQKAKEIGMGGGATAEHLEATFKRELRAHLSEVTRMMSISSPAIVGTQTIALQHFTSILPELEKMFTIVELVSIATTFANAVTASKGKIVIWKLIMYLHMVKGFLFDNAQSRTLLVGAVVIWIKPHFGRYDEYAHTSSNDSDSARDTARLTWLESIRLCVTIIAVMLDKFQQNLINPDIRADNREYRQEQENVEYLLPLLPRLLDSYRELQAPASHKVMEQVRPQLQSNYKSSIPVTFPESYPFSLLATLPEMPRSAGVATLVRKGADDMFSPALGETAVVFLVLILALPVKDILNFLESSLVIEGRERFISLLSQLFKVATSILDNDAFPRTWLNINILAHKVLIKMMEPVATILEKEFIPPQEQESDFDSNLWRECFYMLLRLLSSDQLVIEEFSPQKRRAVWRLAGDIRGEGATILLNLWQGLGSSELSAGPEPPIRYGGYQVYLHSLVGHVVNLCLSHHDQLRNNAVQMLFSMIVTEYYQSEHFDGIENELVTRLDSLFMSDSKGDDISRAFFIGQLRHLFTTPDVDEQLRDRVSNFLDSVDLFLELLLSVRDLPEGEEFQDDRVMATLRLMNFIRRIGRDEIYIKYVHQLVNMHLQSQNYVEAALTLKLHSDLHEWDLNSFVGPMEDLGLPQQSHFHRKETLCLLILNYLGQGKAWETAIEICKELAFQHSEITFNYSRLSEILKHQATLLEHIVNEQRYYPDYYRVTFYGNFPAAIRDKRFIYRGYEWEKFGAFCERMLNKHPGAQLLKTPGDPPVDIRFGNDQYIQCTAVTPEPNRSAAIFTNPDVPLAVRTYYEHSAINLFSSSRQVKKSARDGAEEIWHEKTYLTTEETFPTVLRRSEVVGVEIIEISPLENALIEVDLKTKELLSLHQKYQALAKTAQHVSTNALAMSLNSAVDAPLNTGIASYRQTFFHPDYLARNPERAESVEKLRIGIDEQVRVIDSCLKLHGHLCPPEFIPFHETLEKFFKRNFREEIRRLAVDVPESTSPIMRSPAYQFPSPQGVLVGDPNRFVISPLQVVGPILTPSPLSPQSPASTSNATLPLPNTKQQTPLQRHLAHLARHGITGVASAPGDMVSSDSMSVESPRNSFINVGNNTNAIQSSSTAQVSGTSVAPSYIGSIGSFSLKGRLSRFGSLTFGGRRNASTT
ncbi:hypothetical protein P691DRAFT_796987 [Macrolepiota fuliginosa MF-IS2]|uniref:Cytoplasmic protein n=1 Tax=Macrolepiota fuliginosa MF-IS2 TaxID=1400762 RepID=A0A9P5XIC1_9AGAR|nr:hypothetical protein P691DRAFT_796987 [Macrolepiota fuliginosa MF-IS2]